MFYGNSFRSEDYLQNMEVFQKWQSKEKEQIDEYTLRKRKAELRALVKKVINDELTKEQQLLVRLHWYEGLSTTQIARKLGVSRSTVFRRLENINDIIYDKLKYAMMYRYGHSFSTDVKLIIKNADSLLYDEKPSDISQRLSALRKKQCLTIYQLSSMTGISPTRLEETESKGNSLTAAEIKKLSAFYNVSGDYILFGKSMYCS